MIYLTATKMTEKNQIDELFNILIKTNLSGVRFNLCKYSNEEISELIFNLKNWKSSNLSFMFDLPFPRNKVRIKSFNMEGNKIKENNVYYITSDKNSYEKRLNSIFVEKTDLSLIPGTVIYYADGQGAFRVEQKIDEHTWELISVNNFDMYRNKGIGCGFVSGIDYRDSIKEISHEFNSSTLLFSFVESEDDVVEIKKITNLDNIIVPKLETNKAIKNLQGIISKADGVLIARGDLALNSPFENLLENTELIHEVAKKQNKIVISATDILRNSDFRLVPERSELIDVLNMAKLGTDIVVLPSDKDLVINNFEVNIINKINQKIMILEKCLSKYRGEL